MNILNRIWFLLVPGCWWIVLWWAAWSALFIHWYGFGWSGPFLVLLALNAYRFGEGASCRG